MAAETKTGIVTEIGTKETERKHGNRVTFYQTFFHHT
jgi:hypothetical protein